MTALSGLKVLELATGVAGPFCGKLFADFGADVVKLEPPGGDISRTLGPFREGLVDPEASGLFLYLNTGKRSVAMDLGSPEGSASFRRLVRTADVVIESFSPGVMESMDLGFDTLECIRPGIVVTSVTDFGQSGPWRDRPATDLIHYAASGLAGVNGVKGKEPLKHQGYQSYYQAGSAVFAGTMTALLHRDVTGEGQFVDASALEAMATIMAPYLASYAYTGELGDRPSDGPYPRPPFSTRLMPCLDGYISLSPRSDATWKALWEFFCEPEVADDPRFATTVDRRRNVDEMNELLAPYLARFNVAELFHALGPLRVLVGMTMDIPGLVEDMHLGERNFFSKVSHPAAGDLVMPGPAYKLSATPGDNTRPAPLLGQHSAEVLSEIRGQDAEDMPLRSRPRNDKTPPALPLAGTRAVVLTQAWAGAVATQLLADMGAEVIQVESPTRLDPWRALIARENTPPGLGSNAKIYNIRAAYNSVNRNKYTAILDLATTEGKEAFMDLVAVSDVVAENFAARVTGNLGIDYEDLRVVNPSVIMLRMPTYGCYGPYAGYSGNGGSTEPMTGLSHLNGSEGGPPMNTGVMYTDPVSGILGFGALTIAMHHRNRTGEGQLIDLSHQETVIICMGEKVMEYTLAGHSPGRRGNRDPMMAPHGCFPCLGDDRWVAIAVRSDEEWRALCLAADRPDLAEDARFATLADRQTASAEVDRAVSAWTSGLSAEDVAGRLQRAGVPAEPVSTIAEVMENPQLRARGFFETDRHPEAGTHDLAGMPWKLSRTPGSIRFPAPLYGEQNDLVFQNYLGLTKDDVDRLRAAGVTADEPVGLS